MSHAPIDWTGVRAIHNRATRQEIKMALSKKHYEAMSSDIARELDVAETNVLITPAQAAYARIALRNVAINLCTTFRRDNAAFDGQRFLAACGF
jgi:hypothetical protein